MTRAVVARVAGATFLLYIAVKVAGSILFEGSIGSGVAASRLAAVAAHASDLRIATVLALANCVCALVMGASLYFYTRSSHAELSTFVLICRTGEAVLFGVYALGIIAVVFMATSSTQASRDTDAAFVVAIAHTTFNLLGILIFYPVPMLRRIPVAIAEWTAEIGARRRSLIAVYIIGVFFVLPIVILFIT